LQLYPHLCRALGKQRHVAKHLDGVAQALLAVDQNRAAGERLAWPVGRLEIGLANLDARVLKLPPAVIPTPAPLEVTRQQGDMAGEELDLRVLRVLRRQFAVDGRKRLVAA
jgi:hypothetical protein